MKWNTKYISGSREAVENNKQLLCFHLLIPGYHTLVGEEPTLGHSVLKAECKPEPSSSQVVVILP